MSEVQSSSCPDIDDELYGDYEEYEEYEKVDEEYTGRFKSNICATDNKTGSYKNGDVLVSHSEGRAYLHGIVNSESHFVDSHFSYVEIDSSIVKSIQSRMKTSMKKCGENQLKCPSGICLDEKYVCNGKPDCKDGWDEMDCQPILFPKTEKGFQNMEAKLKEIEVDNWKKQVDTMRMKQRNQRMEEENKKLEEENQRMEEMKTRLQKENQRIQNENKNIQEKNQNINAENKRIVEENKRMKEEIKRMSEENRLIKAITGEWIKKQGQIHRYPSCVRVGRDCI